VEIPFGDKDQQGDFTLRHGDWVQFNIATDRRDSLHRATNIKVQNNIFVNVYTLSKLSHNLLSIGRFYVYLS
jgi:hypothetical protein